MSKVHRPRLYVYVCQYCGKEYHPKEKDRNKYCSRECYFADKERKAAERKVNTTRIRPICVVCGKEFDGRPDRKYCSDECVKLHNNIQSFNASKNKHDKMIKPRACKECGVIFTPEYGVKSKEYCSKECAIKYAHAKSKKRLSRCKVIEQGITLNKLYKKDNGICHICGKPCDYNHCITGEHGTFIALDNYPSIDHVKPIARGGNHTWENVKLAHMRCNTLKGDAIQG